MFQGRYRNRQAEYNANISLRIARSVAVNFVPYRIVGSIPYNDGVCMPFTPPRTIPQKDRRVL
jgi:hypothetical protein